MNIDITHPEREVLINLINASLGELRDELCSTDGYEFKENLMYQKALLQQFLLKLQEMPERRN